MVDDQALLGAEAAHLSNRNDNTRREVIDAYVKCGLLAAVEADNVKSVIDYFGADFFELMGLVYANAGMFISFLYRLGAPRIARSRDPAGGLSP